MTARTATQKTEEGAPDWRLQLPPENANGHELAPLDEEVFEETPADRIAKMLGAVAGDDRASVKLYRVVGPNKYAWCDDYSPVDFEAGGLTMIREKWGVGEYQIRLYAVHPASGTFGVRAKDNVTIFESKTPTASAPSGELAGILKSMADNQAAMLKALTEKPAALDPMQQMASMMSLMGMMRKAMGIGDNKPQSQISEIIAAVRELKGVSEELNPAKEAGDSDPLGAALPGLMEIIKAQMGQAPSAPQAPMLPVMLPPSVQLPSTPVGAVAEIPTPDPSEDDTMAMIRAYMTILCGMAKGGDATVDTAAAMVYEQLPDELIEVIRSEVWFEQLAALYPQVQAFRPWFDKVRAAVLVMLAEDDAEDTKPGALAS